TLSYAGLSLTVPERVRFRYRLDGFDSDWSEPVTAREAVYTNLGPASYRFRVVATDSDSWNGTEADLWFTVAPLIRQTWWFRTGLVVLVMLIAFAIYRFNLHRLAKRLNVRFEERLEERTRIAQDLHDTLLQGFLSASMQANVIHDTLPED